MLSARIKVHTSIDYHLQEADINFFKYMETVKAKMHYAKIVIVIKIILASNEYALNAT